MAIICSDRHEGSAEVVQKPVCVLAETSTKSLFWWYDGINTKVSGMIVILCRRICHLASQFLGYAKESFEVR